ncbi:MAG: hypothetical protein K5644_05220 [Lachnospiraceae bacterium]|nr:hypothetical protein [Lachnospiraceae bacterium]
MLNPNLIKKKSKELDIPFDNLLMGCCLEELLVFISENNRDDLWLINDRSLGLESYKRGFNDTLIAAYNGEDDMETFMRKLSLSVVSYFMNLGVKVKTEFLADNHIQFLLQILNMEVPVILVVQAPREVNTFPREKSFNLSLENAKAVHYMEYPLEEKAAELAFDILDKLELLNEMHEYIDLYDLLKAETVEGRKVEESLSGKCKEKPGFDMARFEKLQSYSNYTYMKKKWKRLKRATKRNDLEWEEVHGLVVKFLEPIYKAIVDEEVFFGDWIPEIARFLD